MKWEKIVRYQTVVAINRKVYQVSCICQDEYSIYVDGEYAQDLDHLPSKEELEQLIKEKSELDYIASADIWECENGL